MQTKKINTNMVSLEATEGMSLRRKGHDDYSIVKKVAINKADIDNWEEVSIETLESQKEEAEKEREYKERVETLIREKYSQGDEDAIKRKMLAALVVGNTLSEHQNESILEEFKEYNDFAEECKLKAKEEFSKTK